MKMMTLKGIDDKIYNLSTLQTFGYRSKNDKIRGPHDHLAI
jgi:hypothetical protein